MGDFLFVHDAGQGAWCWGKVWGYLTAPAEHPPRLHVRRAVGKLVSVDLPGHGTTAGGDVSRLSFDDFVSAVTDAVRAQDLRDLTMVGHGIAAPIILHAAAKLEQPPKRIVLLAGFIPDEGKSALEMLPRSSKLGLKLIARLNGRGMMARLNGRGINLRLPKAVINSLYCNGMDPFEVIKIVGRFCPLPVQLLQSRVYLNDLARMCPVTYVPLWRDKLLSPRLQRRMAERLGNVEMVAELDSCHEVMIEHPRQVADLLLRYA